MPPATQKVLITVVVVVSAVILFIGGTIFGAAVYGWRAAQRVGNEAATRQNLKTIAVVETQYFNTHKSTFGTFDQLIKEQMLSSKFASNPVDGYILDLKLSGAPQLSYIVNADPQDSSSGRSHFYIESTSAQIYVNPDNRASSSDPTQ